MPSLTGWRFWPIREAIDIGVGADIGAFGLGGSGRWIGVLGGPASIARFRPLRAPLSFELAARLDFGRIPVCNDWGLCARYLGFFPAVEAAAAYAWPQHLAIAVHCGVRAVKTLAWSGAAVEPALAGRLFW